MLDVRCSICLPFRAGDDWTSATPAMNGCFSNPSNHQRPAPAIRASDRAMLSRKVSSGIEMVILRLPSSSLFQAIAQFGLKCTGQLSGLIGLVLFGKHFTDKGKRRPDQLPAGGGNLFLPCQRRALLSQPVLSCFHLRRPPVSRPAGSPAAASVLPCRPPCRLPLYRNQDRAPPARVHAWPKGFARRFSSRVSLVTSKNTWTGRFLPHPIGPADALFQHGRVPGQIDIDDGIGRLEISARWHRHWW